jgi:hypothetical protein
MASRRSLGPQGDPGGMPGGLPGGLPGGPPENVPGPQGPDNNINIDGQIPNGPPPGTYNPGDYNPEQDQQFPSPTPLPKGPETSHDSESPRDRSQTTMRRPMSPTPAPPNTAELIPFQPMGDMSANNMVQRRSPGLFGTAGGLKGGGLGLPMDPTNSAANQDVSGLLQMLMQMKGSM